MESGVGFAMYMGIKWKTQCSFVFAAWTTQNPIPYAIGLLISIIVTYFTFSLPQFKSMITGQQTPQKQTLLEGDEIRAATSNKSLTLQNMGRLAAYYFLYSLMHTTVMMLFMTFNGGVVIAVMIGMALAHIVSTHKDTDSDSPINCCANSA